jgi:hypothetical protein
MSVFQLWIVVGVPAVAASVVMLVGGSPVRARVALVLLTSFAVLLAFFPGGGSSIAVLAVPIIVLVASGRLEGPSRVSHHQERQRLTRVAGN